MPMPSCDFLLFLCLISLRTQVCHTLQECSKKTLSIQEYERENNEKAPKTELTKIHTERKKLANWSLEAFLCMRPLFSSFSFIFLHFPPYMQPVTFHLLLLLISTIFINKCAKIPFFLFNALAIAFANFLNHKQPNENPLGCPAHHSAWNTCPIIHGIYIFLHGIFTRAVTEPSPLGEHHPWCLMTPITNTIVEKKTYYPWSFIT